MNINIGLKIKELLEQKSISPNDLAKKIGKTPAAVYDFLKKPHMNTEQLAKIAEALDVPITIFFNDNLSSSNLNELKKLENTEITYLKELIKAKDKQIELLEQLINK